MARVAGNSAVPILEDSLRFGTEDLGASVLFALSHSLCGAAQAAVEYYLERIADSYFEIPIPEVFSEGFSGEDFDWSYYRKLWIVTG